MKQVYYKNIREKRVVKLFLSPPLIILKIRDKRGYKCKNFFKLIFIGIQLLYNVVLVPTVQQNESCVHISPLFWISFPFRSLQCIKQSSLCDRVCSRLLSINMQYQYCIWVNPNIRIPPTPPFPLGIHTFVLCVCVSISAFQIGSPIPFFQIQYIC